VNKKKLKEIIKEIIREEFYAVNEVDYDKMNKFKFTNQKPTLRFDPDFDFSDKVKKSQEFRNQFKDLQRIKKIKKYDDNLIGKTKELGDSIKDTDWFKTADKIGKVVKDKKIDFKLGKGNLEVGKIGTYDPLSTGVRDDLNFRKYVQGDTSIKIPEPQDTFGLKYTIPIGKKS
tara:strand:- start:239 stop:757 length:519 start_codon:yes stop_codon:yes gene_type:complete